MNAPQKPNFFIIPKRSAGDPEIFNNFIDSDQVQTNHPIGPLYKLTQGQCQDGVKKFWGKGKLADAQTIPLSNQNFCSYL